MGGVPKILYKLTWSWPGTDGPERHAFMDHEASLDVAAALEARGAVVGRRPAGRPADEPSRLSVVNPRAFADPVDPGRVSSGNGTEFS